MSERLKMWDGLIYGFSANQMHEEISQRISNEKESAIDIKVSRHTTTEASVFAEW